MVRKMPARQRRKALAGKDLWMKKVRVYYSVVLRAPHCRSLRLQEIVVAFDPIPLSEFRDTQASRSTL